MKLRKLTLISAIALGLFSCGGSSESTSTEAVETTSTEENSEAVEAVTYTVETDASEVAWYGEVAGVKSHNGVISIAEGTLEVAGDKLTGGNIVIDMTTIVPLDSANYTPEEEDGKGKASHLVGHLSNGDFFLVEEFPTASFKIKSMANGKLVGDLTIRGNTNEETVEVSEFAVTEEGVTGKGQLIFDRQKYDVSYQNAAADFVISNDIKLDIEINATK